MAAIVFIDGISLETLRSFSSTEMQAKKLKQSLGTQQALIKPSPLSTNACKEFSPTESRHKFIS